MRAYERVLFAIAALLVAPPLFAQGAGGGPVIWLDRGDVAALDLVHGSGGTGGEPGSAFRFIEESDSGTSPKFDVEDEHGIRWKAKLGEETRSETAATRLLWAAGYVVDDTYYRPQIRVLGLPRLARGQEFVSRGDTVTGVRLEREFGGPASTHWSWYDNPFVGTREFNGLRVMMALLNNWDLKAVNNGTSGAVVHGGTQYGITDLGATFGRTGNSLGRSKGVIKDYAEMPFIDKVTRTDIDLVMHSRPFFLTVFNVPNYRMRSRMESVAKHIPIADARWIGHRLGQLSPGQISDAFRAAGFQPAEVVEYSRVVAQRIAALESLGDVAVPPAIATNAERDAKRCLASTCRDVPVRETLSAINLGSPYVRAVMGGFEQGSGIGGGVQLTSAAAIPAVEFRAAALTSTQGYRRLDLEAFLPNIGGTRNHVDVWFSHLQRDVEFFGIGSQTSTDLATEFALTRRSYQGSLYRDLANNLQGGLYTQIMNAVALLDATRTSTRILSYGAFLAYDTRDNRVGLTRGVNIYGRVASADGLGSTDYGWIEKELDVRGYVPLGSPRTSLLLRSRAQFKTPKGASQIPFYELSWLGGREYLRGYHSYRFRDNNVLLLSTELQRTVYSMTSVRGVDAFASADTGQVWGDDQDVSSRHWHSGLGGGLQYRHSRSLAARVEVGRSQERAVIYVSLSRGF